MLRSLVESKLLTNFLIIQDKADLSGWALFASLLESHHYDGSFEKINLICYENPPRFYMINKKCTNGKIISYDYFSLKNKVSLEWNNPSASKTDLTSFLLNPKNLSETVFFIDSISSLAYYHGFCATYRSLCSLKEHSKKIICVVHSDLFKAYQLEELYFLATTYIKLQGFSVEKSSKEEIISEITYHKPGGKVIKQKELFCISDSFKVISRTQKTEVPILTDIKGNIETLTTFKLTLSMSEEEKRARAELILPYVKTNAEKKEEELMNKLLIQELEDDPDDDLDI